MGFDDDNPDVFEWNGCTAIVEIDLKQTAPDAEVCLALDENRPLSHFLDDLSQAGATMELSRKQLTLGKGAAPDKGSHICGLPVK